MQTDTLTTGDRDRLLRTLQRLLEIPAAEVKGTLDEAGLLVANALVADKVDVFVYDPSIESLVALGTSATPMGVRQHELGLERFPIANGGRIVEVYRRGCSFHTGHADEDAEIPRGVIEGLNIRSMIAVPLEVEGERRGVLCATSATVEQFSDEDLQFLKSVSRWVGMVTGRAEMVERIARDSIEQGRNAAAEEIMTILAHDLGNYLTPLKGRMDMLRRRATRESRERDLADAEAALGALERAQRLVGDLLDTSRLDRGIFALDIREVDLVALAEELATMMSTPQVPIRVQSGEEVLAEVDPNRIRQVMQNLVTNAIKHSPDGVPVVIELSTVHHGDGMWAQVSVRDEGPGIPLDIQPSIFRRFATGPNSTGLGLGLYIARGIVHAHGGTLTVESVQGGGSTFFLRLPLVSQPGT